MKRFALNIDKLVVDAAAIAPMHGEQFRVLVEQALQQRLTTYGAPQAVTRKGKVSVDVPAPAAHGSAGALRLAGRVAQAIHQGLTRKV